MNQTNLLDNEQQLNDALFFGESEEEVPTEAILLQGEGEDAMILTVSLATGEVVQDQLAPPETAHAKEIADYLGPRKTSAHAKLEGLKAERQVHLDKISDMFDARIKQQERICAWLDAGAGFYDQLRQFTENALSGKSARTLALGLLELSLRKKPGTVKLADKDKAIAHLKTACPAAVKVVESVLVSKLTPELKESIKLGELSAVGIEWEPATDTFKID